MPTQGPPGLLQRPPLNGHCCPPPPPAPLSFCDTGLPPRVTPVSLLWLTGACKAALRSPCRTSEWPSPGSAHRTVHYGSPAPGLPWVLGVLTASGLSLGACLGPCRGRAACQKGSTPKPWGQDQASCRPLSPESAQGHWAQPRSVPAAHPPAFSSLHPPFTPPASEPDFPSSCPGRGALSVTWFLTPAPAMAPRPKVEHVPFQGERRGCH